MKPCRSEAAEIGTVYLLVSYWSHAWCGTCMEKPAASLHKAGCRCAADRGAASPSFPWLQSPIPPPPPPPMHLPGETVRFSVVPFRSPVAAGAERWPLPGRSRSSRFPSRWVSSLSSWAPLSWLRGSARTPTAKWWVSICWLRCGPGPLFCWM